MRIHDQRIRFFVERLVALAAPVHKHRHVQRNAFGAAALEFNFTFRPLIRGAFGLCALYGVVNPAHVFIVLRGRRMDGR